MKRLVFALLLALIASAILGQSEASAANSIKLFAPWSAGFKWDTTRGYYFNPPTHEGIDFNGVYDINGTDLGGDAGKPVLAAQDGVVTTANFDAECGWQVYIHHGANVYTRYCHMQNGSLVVGAGTRVLHGQKLGLNGCTGTPCFGDHIHFEVRTGGETGTPELPTPFDGATMAQGQLFLSHNFQERLEVGYRDADFNGNGWPDVGAYEPHLGQWWMARNTSPNLFVSQGVWLNNWGTDTIAGDWRHLTGKFNTGTSTDIAVYNKKVGQ